MTQPPPEVDQAAKFAANEVYRELLAMLLSNETGEVAVVIGFNRLQTEIRPIHKRKAMKLERGRWVLISGS